MNVPELYEQIRDADTDVRDHLPLFVDLVVDLDAVRVCELGVRGGISTIAWLMGLEQTGGHLWGVDLSPAPFDHQRLTFVQGDDCSPEVLAAVPDDLDLVFVDSSHLFIHTQEEIRLWLPKLGDGGALVFHDVDVEVFDEHPEGEPPFPVRRAVEEAAHEGNWEVDFYTGSHGLAVCWPPSEGS